LKLDQLDLHQAATVSLPGLLARRVEQTPEARGIVSVRGEMTFAEWQRRASSISALLGDRFGSLARERFLLWMTNEDAGDFLAAMHALFIRRAIAVALDDRAVPAEARRIIDDTDPVALLLSSQVAKNLGPSGLSDLGLTEPLPTADDQRLHALAIEGGRLSGKPLSFHVASLAPAEFDTAATADDDAIIFFSSGSTGRPKGAMWRQGDLAQYVERAAHAIYALPRDGKNLRSDDVLQSPTAVYTAASVMETPYAAVLAGCTAAYETRRFDPAASERRMGELGTTIYNGAPAHFAMLCNLPPAPAPPALEMVVSGGAALTAPLYHRIRKRWPTVGVANWYGLMESGCGQTLNTGPDIEREPGAIGRPVWPTELRLVDDQLNDVPTGAEGELWTRAPGQMREYYRNPEQTAARLHDGWLRTGDRAVLDAQGLVHMAGRNEERINRGGYKFYPVEIESVLEENGDVSEAAVIGVPHPILGQSAVAFVVPASGASLDPEELRKHCRKSVAANKVPSEILIIDHLPRSAEGKIVRRRLASEYAKLRGEN
jgi:acyl-CoA synthetase (AMP-forming)/AMP-acid ligase II